MVSYSKFTREAFLLLAQIYKIIELAKVRELIVFTNFFKTQNNENFVLFYAFY